MLEARYSRSHGLYLFYKNSNYIYSELTKCGALALLKKLMHTYDEQKSLNNIRPRLGKFTIDYYPLDGSIKIVSRVTHAEEKLNKEEAVYLIGSLIKVLDNQEKKKGQMNNETSV